MIKLLDILLAQVSPKAGLSLVCALCLTSCDDAPRGNQSAAALAAPTPQQEAYLAECNDFAWLGDKVHCEAAADGTLRIYQSAEPSGNDPEADTVKYLYNHPDKLVAIKRAGFGKVEAVVIGGNGPGRNVNSTVALRDDGTFSVLKSCYDGTDDRRHCDPSN